MRITKSLLIAAAVVGSMSATAKAYDLGDIRWNVSAPSNSASFTNFGGDLASSIYVSLDANLADAGVYRGGSGTFTWTNNVYWDGFGYNDDYVGGALTTQSSTPVPFPFDAPPPGTSYYDYIYDFQSDNDSTSGGYNFDSATNTVESTNIAIGQRFVTVVTQADGDEPQGITRSVYAFERAVQVARTGSGAFGANAFTAFESDNSLALSGSFYSPTTFVGRNVLPTATDGPNQLAGSVVRLADIALGFGESEGLFAKDGGWLDIRGDLTLGAYGTILIRDGEITSNIYTQFYAPGTLDPAGNLSIYSGILSVRDRFAQDMSANYGQTLGFRDGAVNATRLYLEGFGYGYDGEGASWGDASNGGGALRAITGDNVQDGNISVVADGEGFGMLDGAVIGADAGAKLTINGAINGLNSFDSEGGAQLGFSVAATGGSAGQIIQNGSILSGVSDVLKGGEGELLVNSANSFTGDLTVFEGSVRITNSGALSGNSGQTYVADGASLVLDQAAGLSLVDTINITGAGTASIGAALHNKSGANVTTGQVYLESGSSTIRVDAGSSLSVGSLSADDTSYALTLDVRGTGADVGLFSVDGSTGGVGSIVKVGTGNATIQTVDDDLQSVDVQGGTLSLKSSSSTSLALHDSFEKNGAGALEVLGNHFYGDFDFNGGTTYVRGNVTLDGSDQDGDFDMNGSSVVNVESGATLLHISSDGVDFDAYTNGMDVVGTSALNVKSGGLVQLNAAEINLNDDATITVDGTISTLDGIYANDDTVLAIRAGGVVNGKVQAVDNARVFINGADGEGLSGGVLNGFVEAFDNATINLGGTINGDVETYDNAVLTLAENAVHNGDYTAYGSAIVTINGSIDNDEGSPLGQNFSIAGSALLKGSGTIGGNLTQTGGTVAPGNSTDVLTVLGNYSINAGSLQIEIGGTDGPGNDPTGNDQLAVGGTVTVGGTAVLDFQPYNTYESVRGGVFQVLATDLGASRATIGRFDTVDLTGLGDRVLFDHSTGKAYGTGLAKGAAGQTFADYGNTANRADLGRALWMESIAKDNSGLDDNYGTGALDPLEVVASSGQKVFILTRDSSPMDATQVRTDLGAAAASVLSAADVGVALDALSPEAYVGISELGVRVARNFAQLPASKRKLAATNAWDFSLGYVGEQITADAGGSSFTNYKVSNDQVNLTAARDLSANLRLTLALGVDDGKVGASGFSADTDTQAFGLGLGFTPDSKKWNAALGVAVTRTDWDATRGVAQNTVDNEDGLGVALRVALAPTTDGAFSYAPYIGLSYASQDQSAVAEVGADNDGMVGVGFAGYERDSLVSELGLKAEYAINPGATLTGVIAWEHEFENGGETTLDAEFTENGVTDTRFAVTSAGFGEDIFRIGVGVRFGLGAQSAFSLSYDALLSSDSKSGQGIKADVSFRF